MLGTALASGERPPDVKLERGARPISQRCRPTKSSIVMPATARRSRSPARAATESPTGATDGSPAVAVDQITNVDKTALLSPAHHDGSDAKQNGSSAASASLPPADAVALLSLACTTVGAAAAALAALLTSSTMSFLMTVRATVGPVKRSLCALP